MGKFRETWRCNRRSLKMFASKTNLGKENHKCLDVHCFYFVLNCNS